MIYCGRKACRRGRSREPFLSKHLRLLRRARVVQEWPEGRHRIYELNVMALKAVESWLNWYRSFWQANLNNLKAVVQREHAKAKSGPQKERGRRKEKKKWQDRG